MPDLGDLLPQIACPTALAWGERSNLMTDETLAYMVGRMPKTVLKLAIPDADHHVMVDQPLACVAGLRGLLANKDLDVVPEIKLLRQRLDDGIHSARESAIRAAQDAARQAKDAAIAADRYAHDEPWRVAGAALAVGALVGFLLARR